MVVKSQGILSQNGRKIQVFEFVINCLDGWLWRLVCWCFWCNDPRHLVIRLMEEIPFPTTWDRFKQPVNNGRFFKATGAGFLPSTVPPKVWYLGLFSGTEYRRFAGVSGRFPGAHKLLASCFMIPTWFSNRWPWSRVRKMVTRRFQFDDSKWRAWKFSNETHHFHPSTKNYWHTFTHRIHVWDIYIYMYLHLP